MPCVNFVKYPFGGSEEAKHYSAANELVAQIHSYLLCSNLESLYTCYVVAPLKFWKCCKWIYYCSENTFWWLYCYLERIAYCIGKQLDFKVLQHLTTMWLQMSFCSVGRIISAIVFVPRLFRTSLMLAPSIAHSSSFLGLIFVLAPSNWD